MLSGPWPDHAVNALWTAVRVGRADRAIGLVAEHGPTGPAQMIGDAVLLALSEGVDAVEHARAVAAVLREREWEGDAVLADEIDAEIGDGPLPMRRFVTVDLEALAMAMESDIGMGSAFLDLDSGAVHYPDWEDGIDASLDDDRPMEWIPQGSNNVWQDMQEFAAGLDDQATGALLMTATKGRGGVRRFKKALDTLPGLPEDWSTFSSERSRGRARAWLADVGLKPRPGGF